MGDTNESGDDSGFRNTGGSLEYFEPAATTEDATGAEGDTGDDDSQQTASGGDEVAATRPPPPTAGSTPGAPGDDGEVSPGAAGPTTTRPPRETTASPRRPGKRPAPDSADDGAAGTGSTNPDRGDDANVDAHPINGPPAEGPESGAGSGATTVAQDTDDGTPAQTAEQGGLYTQDTLGDDELTEATTGDAGRRQRRRVYRAPEPRRRHAPRWRTRTATAARSRQAAYPPLSATTSRRTTPRPSPTATPAVRRRPCGGRTGRPQDFPARTAEQAGLYTQDTLGDAELTEAATNGGSADGTATSAEPQEPGSATPQVAADEQ